MVIDVIKMVRRPVLQSAAAGADMMEESPDGSEEHQKATPGSVLLNQFDADGQDDII